MDFYPGEIGGLGGQAVLTGKFSTCLSVMIWFQIASKTPRKRLEMLIISEIGYVDHSGATGDTCRAGRTVSSSSATAFLT
jgi:hypothetical protein